MLLNVNGSCSTTVLCLLHSMVSIFWISTNKTKYIHVFAILYRWTVYDNECPQLTSHSRMCFEPGTFGGSLVFSIRECKWWSVDFVPWISRCWKTGKLKTFIRLDYYYIPTGSSAITFMHWTHLAMSGQCKQHLKGTCHARMTYYIGNHETSNSNVLYVHVVTL